ncbi:DNA mismatch repair protein MutL [Nitrospira sp. KM1]|uniref:DNA mismatch repair endonuclease MutL n=1 Tax=Nitrospira sp. KM1 TaxID=1936990 RepID=UPI0013A7B126|nr:DNA mismatch repair endonuclease MutL [Nitrospira sp. KM1]BCA54404.1 DNA mismatch repair protein MutL [Nitrospira sp. KM1]
MPAAESSASIHVLPDDVISRIAAGEVIERPAAVVKELIENSLDAGSLVITVDVKDGGMSVIRVTDDGEGIGRRDLPLAFARHATSKLRSDRDLVSVETMGFRGEALPSIASISKVRITTGTEQESAGSFMTLTGGIVDAVRDAPAVKGTMIEVADLFYNQPVRKKFLRSVPTEFSHINQVVQQAGLARPAVHLRLLHNGQEVLNYPSVASDRDRILQVYRHLFLDRTFDVRGRIPGYAVSGVAVDPVRAKSSKLPQDVFVNRRPVRNATVFHAVTEGYGAFLAKGLNPTYVLFLEIEPDCVDVNVHPAKREVRFSQPDMVHRLIRHALRHALAGPERTSIKGTQHAGVAAEVTPTASITSKPCDQRHDPNQPQTGPQDATPRTYDRMSSSDEQLEFAHEPGGAYSSTISVVPLGQMLQRYLVAHVGQELQVIDQHTAHERVLFQRLWRKWQDHDLQAQPLLIPNPVELPVAQYALLGNHLEDLASLGLIIEPFGSGSMAIMSVPVGVGKIDAVSFVQDLMDDLAQWNRTPSLEHRIQSVLASLACHSAIRAGRTMALAEIRQLVLDWIDEGLIMTCPHGRRTAFRLSTDELDKLFGRVGWS